MFIFMIYFLPINAEVIKKIDISGNSRVNEETIKIYGGIEINKDYSEKGLNKKAIAEITPMLGGKAFKTTDRLAKHLSFHQQVR